MSWLIWDVELFWNDSECRKDISLGAALLLRVFIILFLMDSVESLQYLVYIWFDSNGCHINWKSNLKKSIIATTLYHHHKLLMFTLKTLFLCAVLCISWYGFYFKSCNIYHKAFSWSAYLKNNYSIEINFMTLGCASPILMCAHSLLLIFNLYIHQLSPLLLWWHNSVICSF